jgi:hypothetical protein
MPVEGSKFSGIEKTTLREVTKAAELGYMSMNIYRPPTGARWGRFNDRLVDEGWVAELATNFASNLDHCTDGKAIQVAVKKKWLKAGSKPISTADGLTIKDVPVLEFSEESKPEVADDNIWCLGGNHRRKALAAYLDNKANECLRKRAEMEKVLGSGEAEKEDIVGALRRDIERLEAEIATESHWVVRIYDRGTSNASNVITGSWPDGRD